ncbi:MAG TPA: SAM-dependent methyltransferase [Candidatus Acidoferrum sp.]|nr:SAM-dependent methyltransferase [Candidatus Acidoferrum sp.]
MSPLMDILRREIAERGILSFARFMDLVLYCPKHGYYEKNRDNPGRRGDFYTSAGTGELFGQLLAWQFAEWLVELPRGAGGGQIVEAGAHDGRLAGDILSWLQTNRPGLFDQMEYWIIEPSPQRQVWQQETLKPFGTRIRWRARFGDVSSFTGSAADAKARRFHGVIFSNELLDAMPVHRYGWDAANKNWYEWGVALDGERFVWAKIRNPKFKNQNPELEPVLPDGYTIETCPAAEAWWQAAAGALGRGKLMTIDYGLAADELFSPARLRGTVRAYFRHQASDDLLARVGEQDLTAHVNFPAIRKTGEAAGLSTESFQTQAQFLTQILAKAAKSGSLGEWGSTLARQFQTLTHPEHLGRAFRVLIQAR